MLSARNERRSWNRIKLWNRRQWRTNSLVFRCPWEQGKEVDWSHALDRMKWCISKRHRYHPSFWFWQFTQLEHCTSTLWSRLYLDKVPSLLDACRSFMLASRIWVWCLPILRCVSRVHFALYASIWLFPVQWQRNSKSVVKKEWMSVSYWKSKTNSEQLHWCEWSHTTSAPAEADTCCSGSFRS